MADFTFMRGDVGQKIRVQLYEAIEVETVDTVTGVISSTTTYQRIALTNSDSVKLLLKDYTNGTLGTATGGGTCVITSAANSEVQYTMQTADLNQPRIWVMQHEITKAGTGEVITVPDEPDPVNARTLPYLTVEVLPDLG